MAFKDHRDFFAALEREQELVKVTQEVDWDLEVGAIGRRVYEMEGPCLLFEKIKDYPQGFRISNGTTGTWSRVAYGYSSCQGLIQDDILFTDPGEGRQKLAKIRTGIRGF